MSESYDFGIEAERYVAQKYEAKEYTILERNWRFQKAEIDIIALKNNVLIIVEVKARGVDAILSPEQAVNRKKKQLLVMAADAYLQLHDLDAEVRFDIVAVRNIQGKWKCSFWVDAFKAHEI